MAALHIFFFFFLQDVHALHFNPPAPTGF